MQRTENKNRQVADSSRRLASAGQSDAYKKAIKILDSLRRVLRDAGSDAEVTRVLEGMVARLTKMGDHDLELKSAMKPRGQSADFSRDFVSIDLSEVERLLISDTTTRQTLEIIAVKRFNVPKGSLRSFSNLDALKGKLTTLIENERTHREIDQMARNSRV